MTDAQQVMLLDSVSTVVFDELENTDRELMFDFGLILYNYFVKSSVNHWDTNLNAMERVREGIFAKDGKDILSMVQETDDEFNCVLKRLYEAGVNSKAVEILSCVIPPKFNTVTLH